MLAGDPEEIEIVLAFFRKHKGRELNLSISLFDGFTERLRVTVAEVGGSGASRYHVRFLGLQTHQELEIDLSHCSLATVSPDHKEVELGRVLGGHLRFRLTASEIA